MATSADKQLDVLLEIRGLLGEIRDRLPEPAMPSPGLARMASDDEPEQTAPASAGPPVHTDTEGGGDDDDEG
jgi:hypothetical protein